MRRRLLGPVAGAALLAALTYRAWPRGPRVHAAAQVGEPAPPLAAPPGDAAQVTMNGLGLIGRPWLLHAWASWCAPCRDEHPLLLDAARAAAAPIVGLNPHDDPRSAAEWLHRHGDPYAAIVADPDGRIAAAWGLRGVPASVLVDAWGRVRWRHDGALTPARWRHEVLPLLAGGAA
ncbi:MAG: redoxin domain-containing protein [Rubrivivax sp.]|jgi:cytochrome c biogenesis protein CcmG/thiol:disulfide interchange protein DsbE|nr:redoxin domain-containing protein [Rubrivivax sp.]